MRHDIILVMKIEAPSGGEVEGGGGGEAGEAIDGDAIVGKGGVSIPIAVQAEDEVVRGAEDGGGLGGAVVAGLSAEVLAGERVGGRRANRA